MCPVFTKALFLKLVKVGQSERGLIMNAPHIHKILIHEVGRNDQADAMNTQRIHHFFEMKPHGHDRLYKPRKSSTMNHLPSYHIGLRSQGQLQPFKYISQLGSCLLPLLQVSRLQTSLLLSTLDIEVKDSSQTSLPLQHQPSSQGLYPPLTSSSA